jgi:hypothetical protein
MEVVNTVGSFLLGVMGLCFVFMRQFEDVVMERVVEDESEYTFAQPIGGVFIVIAIALQF